MKLLTYTSYKKHCELHTEIHGSIVVNGCQIELAQKDTILLSKCLHKRTSVENNTYINFNLSAGTYSINDFNTRIKETVSQQRQD